jgi:hypothetical protein
MAIGKCYKLGLFFSFSVLRLELRTYTVSHSASPFIVMGFSDLGSHELFAQAGFKPLS